jgi:hypothetical protein
MVGYMETKYPICFPKISEADMRVSWKLRDMGNNEK